MPKKISQPALSPNIPDLDIAAPDMAPAELPDEKPYHVKADLRKFNRTEMIVNASVKAMKEFPAINSHEDVALAQELLGQASTIEKAVEKKRLQLSKPYRDQTDRINNYGKDLLKPMRPAIDGLKDRILLFHKADAARVQQVQNDLRHQQLLDIGLIYFDQGRPEVTAPHYNDPSTGRNLYCADLENASGPIWLELLQAIAGARQDLHEAKMRELSAGISGAEFFGEDIDELQQELEMVKISSAAASAMPHVPNISAQKVQGLTKRWKFEITDPELVPRAYCTPDEKRIREEVAAGARNIPGVRIFEEESISIRS